MASRLTTEKVSTSEVNFRVESVTRCEISRSPSYRALRRRGRSMLVRLSLGRSSLIAGAAQSVGTCDLVPKKRVVSLRTGCCSSPKSSGFRGPRMRSGISGSETPSSGRRVTRVVREAAWSALEHASAPPLSPTLCALRAQALHAAQGQVRSRRTQVAPSLPAGREARPRGSIE